MEENFLKLAGTIYKIIDFFPESDPLKNKAKEKALCIMDKLVLGASINSEVEMLLGYLKIACMQGWLNGANYLIICNEFEKIKAEKKNIPKKEQKTVQEDKPQKTEKHKETLSERQKKILKFLEHNEKAQVMDLQKVLGQVTKRTIRRDLDELLRENRIVRAGEWNQVAYKING